MMHYIRQNENILAGEPVITGTRIPVERLAYLVKSGYTEENLKREFGGINVKKIRGALYELASLGLERLR
ncbi:conserved hypothetical protein [Frankia canadensis]|uniref:DUF433 domain-containing protein n=1 Tax=Frankia canadensis TaxID=1836972 RepID=A0A2I2KUK8_9ACTN|nr:conserved hypothetical protein [Frankia canadensis]SOU56647.1 conserved hypothetical protein [Frankia canadensis]